MTVKQKLRHSATRHQKKFHGRGITSNSFSSFRLMVFCNFLSVHFYCDEEEEEKEEQEQEKQEKEKKLYSHYRKTFNVQPSCLDSAEDEKDISRKSTEKPTKTNRNEKSDLL